MTNELPASCHPVPCSPLPQYGQRMLATVLFAMTFLLAGCDSFTSNNDDASVADATPKTEEVTEAKPPTPSGARTPQLSEPRRPRRMPEPTLSPRIGISPKPAIDNNVDSSEINLDVNSNPNDPTDLRLLSWNVESEGAEGDVIAEQLSVLNDEDRYDIVGLTEVLPADMKKYRNALGVHYKYAYSKSGRNDRMQILFNENKFEKIRHFELEEINLKNRYRAPLVVHFKKRDGGQEFLVMINHLARGKAEMRQTQAKMLVEWARDETMPILALGDYNFDYVFETKQGNPAFNNFLRDNIYLWVKPEAWIDTNWYDDPREPDGADDYPGSMLDFAFAANAAKEWTHVCRVLVRENDFPDDQTTSDHRPFEWLIDVSK